MRVWKWREGRRTDLYAMPKWVEFKCCVLFIYDKHTGKVVYHPAFGTKSLAKQWWKDMRNHISHNMKAKYVVSRHWGKL